MIFLFPIPPAKILYFMDIFPPHSFQRLAYRVVVFDLQAQKFFFQLLCYFFGAFLSVEVMHLCRIVLQVVQFPAVDVVIETNQFVTLCPHSKMSSYGMLGRIFVEVIIERGTPIVGMFSLEERQV